MSSFVLEPIISTAAPTAGQVLSYIGPKWTPIIGLLLHVTEVDFGSGSLAEQTFVVADAFVSSSSIIVPIIAGTPTGKDDDEIGMDSFMVTAVPTSGSITFFVRGLEGSLGGNFKIAYTIG